MSLVSLHELDAVLEITEQVSPRGSSSLNLYLNMVALILVSERVAHMRR